MGGFGGPELLVVFVVVLLVFGPQKIPEVARAIGKAAREFRRLSVEFQRELNIADALEGKDHRGARRPPRAPAGAPPDVPGARSLDVEIDPSSPHARAAATPATPATPAAPAPPSGPASPADDS